LEVTLFLKNFFNFHLKVRADSSLKASTPPNTESFSLSYAAVTCGLRYFHRAFRFPHPSGLCKALPERRKIYIKEDTQGRRFLQTPKISLKFRSNPSTLPNGLVQTLAVAGFFHSRLYYYY
jgi:hypothetical protein